MIIKSLCHNRLQHRIVNFFGLVRALQKGQPDNGTQYTRHDPEFTVGLVALRRQAIIPNRQSRAAGNQGKRPAMKLARILLAAVAATSITQAASAQFDPNAPTSSDVLNVTNFGPYSPYGMYQGQLLSSPGQPTVDLLCDDFLHTVAGNTPFAVNITRFDAGASAFDSRTRFGSAAFTNGAYLKAAYLSNFFAGLSNPSAVQDLHSAIWHLFTPAAPAAILPGETYWTTLLSNNTSAWQGIDLSRYFVVSDVNTIRGIGGNQEFLMQTVPEPGSVLMLSTGLLSLVGLARFRRRRNSA